MLYVSIVVNVKYTTFVNTVKIDVAFKLVV